MGSLYHLQACWDKRREQFFQILVRVVALGEVPSHGSSGRRKTNMATVKTIALMEKAEVGKGGVG